ncbi:MAG: hypothetical protein WC825_02260 [Gallionellaceae bacterium]|jgi:hypothetical protein
MNKAIEDVLAERQRQIQQEGWSATHDDEHDSGDLCCAGSAYALNAGCQINPYMQQSLEHPPAMWPAAWDRSWWKPKDPRRDLVRAAALIIAEIERMDRKAGAA